MNTNLLLRGGLIVRGCKARDYLFCVLASKVDYFQHQLARQSGHAWNPDFVLKISLHRDRRCPGIGVIRDRFARYY